MKIWVLVQVKHDLDDEPCVYVFEKACTTLSAAQLEATKAERIKRTSEFKILELEAGICEDTFKAK